jgi:hypothetical protein
MKANTHDWLDDLSPERRENVERTIAEAGRQSDEHMQRVCSSFGYKHGGYWAMCMWIMATLIFSVFAVIGLALYVSSGHTMTFQEKLGVMGWMVYPPFVIVPVLIFIFMKLKYAVRVLGVMIVLLIIAQFTFHFLDGLLYVVLKVHLGL